MTYLQHKGPPHPPPPLLPLHLLQIPVLKMTAKWYLIVCVVAIWAVDLGSSSHHARAPAPAPSVECSNLVLTLSDCLTFVSNGSTVTKPQGTCCSSLKTVLNTAPKCLCEAFNSSAQLGLAINVTKAVTLPAACKLSTPSAANCGREFFLFPPFGFSHVLFFCVTHTRVFSWKVFFFFSF